MVLTIIELVRKVHSAGVGRAPDSCPLSWPGTLNRKGWDNKPVNNVREEEKGRVMRNDL